MEITLNRGSKQSTARQNASDQMLDRGGPDKLQLDSQVPAEKIQMGGGGISPGRRKSEDIRTGRIQKLNQEGNSRERIT